MSDPSDRLINLLGALATGVADRVRGAALDGTTFGGPVANPWRLPRVDHRARMAPPVSEATP